MKINNLTVLILSTLYIYLVFVMLGVPYMNMPMDSYHWFELATVKFATVFLIITAIVSALLAFLSLVSGGLSSTFTKHIFDIPIKKD